MRYLTLRICESLVTKIKLKVLAAEFLKLWIYLDNQPTNHLKLFLYMLNQVDRILYYPTTELMENFKTKLHDRSFVKYRPAVKLRQHSNYVIRIITICCVWQTIQSHSLIFRVVVPWTSPKKPKLHNSQTEVWNKNIYK